MKKSFVLILTLCLLAHGSEGFDASNIAYAVNLGYPVTYSTSYNADHTHYNLDNVQRDGIPSGWAVGISDMNQWIQVNIIVPQTWVGVITQGRGDQDQWVTTYMVLYSSDGVNWNSVDDGRIFNGNSDRNTQVTNYFNTPVNATTIRIKPISWSPNIAMRFDALFSRAV